MDNKFRSDGRVDMSLSSEQTRDAALLRATTELFAQGMPHDRDEIRRYEELAVHFLSRVAVADRTFVAEELAVRIDAPLTVVRMLAKDKIEVASAVIRRSSVLGSLDLLAVIAATSVEHHRLVARRPGLSAEVERALRLLGDGEVIGCLDAAKGPAPADIRSEPAAAAPTPSPAAPPPPNASSGWFTQRQAARLGPDRFDPWVFLSLDRAARLRLMADLATRPPIRRYVGPANRLDRAFRSILGAAQIVGFARSSQRSALIGSIAEALDVGADLVMAALDDATGEALAVLLKALSLDNVQAQQVFLLASPTGRDVSAFFRLADLYAGMETVVAETLVEAWRGDIQTSPLRHEPLFAENGQLRRPSVTEQSRDRLPPAADRANSA
jgi:hypothetical protein